jgi:hypothetical protein
MSIFKGTLAPEIAAQLKARESIVNGSRKDEFLRYTTGKNSWVRMASFVNTNSSDALSKKWVLEGGVPFGTELRSGVAKKDGIYANDLANNDNERPFGYRPMPGITSISVSNKGAYGSLRQTVIRYQCWDRHQLDQLEKLYMRVGYTVLVEWGWSQYIDHPASAGGINKTPDPFQTSLKNFTDRPIDPFASWTEDGLYDAIDKNVSKYKGNYDAMIGYIQNFSWQLMPNGGFDCSTTLISRGEVLTEIKSSSNPYTIVDSSISGTDYVKSTYDATGAQQERAVLSLFEKIFLNIKAFMNQGEILDAGGEFYIKYDASVSDSQRKINSEQIQNQVTASFQNIVSSINGNTYKFYNNSSNTYYDGSYKSTISLKTKSGNSNLGFLKPTDGKSDGSAIEYVTFDDLIAILNTFFLPKNAKTGRQIINIVIPNTTECLVCEDSVSIDPTTCLLSNPYASFITEYTGPAPAPIGFYPRFYELTPSSIIPSDPMPSSSFDASDPYFWGANFVVPKSNSLNSHNDQIYTGELGNLLISISKIIEVYRRIMTSDGVSVIDYLQALLEEISFALGGINDFKVYTTRNLIHIIDAKYLETSAGDGAYSKKFKFNLIGLKSICRDVKINSRIFSEQASMIAIGAAASGEQQNIGDIYSSTQQAFNKGLSDRLINGAYITKPPAITRVDVNGKPIPKDLEYYYDIYKNFISIRDYLRRKVLGVPLVGGNIDIVRIPSSEEIVNTSSLLKSFLLQLDGKDLDFKAIIPLELEITLDGISGFIIGQIFTVDESVLPSAYTNSKVGLIITGVSHILQNNDWTTILKTQMCLLENDKISNNGRIEWKKKIKNIIVAISKQQKTNSYLALAMADYLTYLTVGILYVGNPSEGIINKKGNKLGLTETQRLPTVRTIPANLGGGSSKDDHFVYIDPNSNFYDQANLALDAKDSVNGAVEKVAMVISQDIPFYDKAKTGNSYLEKWYNIVKPLNLPDFPSTFNDLVNAKLPGGGGLIVNLEDDLVMFNEEVIASASGNGNWATINTALVRGNQVFFYKYLGLTPLKTLKGYQVSPGTNTPTATNYDNTDKTVMDLEINKLYQVYLLNNVTNFINSRTNLKTYTNPRAYTSFYSLESGPAGTNVIWHDGYKFYGGGGVF